MSDPQLEDIPGTYVMTSGHFRKGYQLNMFCMSLNEQSNRDNFRADEGNYLNSYSLNPEQRAAILSRDWLELLRLGGNIYYTFKLAVFDGLNMQSVGAMMSNTSEHEFRQMMISGGRSIEGNRSKKEQN